MTKSVTEELHASSLAPVPADESDLTDDQRRIADLLQAVTLREGQVASLQADNVRLGADLGQALTKLLTEQGKTARLEKERNEAQDAEHVALRRVEALEKALRAVTVSGPDAIGLYWVTIQIDGKRAALPTDVRAYEGGLVVPAWKKLRDAALSSPRSAPAPCSGCDSTTAERSACPSCGKVFCQPCAEEPYASCCDGKGARAETRVDADDLHEGPQDLEGLAAVLAAQPRVESLDHLLDAERAAPEPRCPKCGAEAKRATRVPGWSCPSCGCLFRQAAERAAPAGPREEPCGCTESYPQLVPGRVSHGPGCPHREEFLRSLAPPEPAAEHVNLTYRGTLKLAAKMVDDMVPIWLDLEKQDGYRNAKPSAALADAATTLRALALAEPPEPAALPRQSAQELEQEGRAIVNAVGLKTWRWRAQVLHAALAEYQAANRQHNDSEADLFDHGDRALASLQQGPPPNADARTPNVDCEEHEGSHPLGEDCAGAVINDPDPGNGCPTPGCVNPYRQPHECYPAPALPRQGAREPETAAVELSRLAIELKVTGEEWRAQAREAPPDLARMLDGHADWALVKSRALVLPAPTAGAEEPPREPQPCISCGGPTRPGSEPPWRRCNDPACGQGWDPRFRSVAPPPVQARPGDLVTVQVDSTLPTGQAEFRIGDEVVGTITNIGPDAPPPASAPPGAWPGVPLLADLVMELSPTVSIEGVPHIPYADLLNAVRALAKRESSAPAEEKPADG